MRKYFVYVDDGCNCYKIAVPTENEEKAREYAQGNGEIIAVKDVTAEVPISLSKVSEALNRAGFGETERNFIVRSLEISGIADHLGDDFV